MASKRKFSPKRLLLTIFLSLILLAGALVVVANVYVEPVLRKRLHVLIVEGSDSLYTYKLGSLNANFFGGNVEVNDLAVSVDSNRFKQLQLQDALPALVIQLNIKRASIKGIGVFSLLFSKKIFIDEISSNEADVKMNRYLRKKDTVVVKNTEPLWKAIQNKINDVAVKEINLNGIKLLYKNEEGTDAAKLQFDRCDALFKNIRIDSLAMADTSRIGYVENFSLKFHDLKFRTSDSLYKMKAEWIIYNSAQRQLQVDSFKLQPTLENDERIDTMRKSWYTVTFDKVVFDGLRLDRYLRFNRAEADSVVFINPKLKIFQDKKGEKSYKSKIGDYPHQKLLEARTFIDIKAFIARNMQVHITEKHETTGEEGNIVLNELQMRVENIVNDPILIKRNNVTTATATGKIIGSPIQASFRFYLDSADGRFDLKGHIGAVSAAQVNPIATTLANIEVPTLQVNTIDFFVRGEDFGATADVQMTYNNLALIFRKRDEETGTNSTRTFLTRILNRYGIHSANPVGGQERKAFGVKAARLTTQSFFGLIWQSVFAGMQRIMLKSG